MKPKLLEERTTNMQKLTLNSCYLNVKFILNIFLFNFQLREDVVLLYALKLQK